jgi:hypothetical protein
LNSCQSTALGPDAQPLRSRKKTENRRIDKRIGAMTYGRKAWVERLNCSV